ncbi:MAG: DUF6263 family protein [candidate division Zixibacteria bacterium]
MNKFPLISAVIVLSAVCFFAAESRSDEPLDLRLILAEGDNYECVMDLTRDVTQNIDGDEQILNQELNISWNYEITAVRDDGIIDLTMTYKRIRIKQDFGFNQSEYDSDNPPSYIEPSMKGYVALVGSILEVSLDDKGNVVRLSGAEDLIDRMIAEIDLPDSPMKDQMISGIRSQFGEDALRESLLQMTSFYPSTPVSAGDDWSSEKSLFNGFPMHILNRYTLVSRDNGIAEIRVESEIAAGDDSSGIEMGPVSIFYDIAGAQNGIIEVDQASGLPVRSEMEMGFEGIVNVYGLPDGVSRSWPIKADGRVVVTFEKK